MKKEVIKNTKPKVLEALKRKAEEYTEEKGEKKEHRGMKITIEC